MRKAPKGVSDAFVDEIRSSQAQCARNPFGLRHSADRALCCFDCIHSLRYVLPGAGSLLISIVILYIRCSIFPPCGNRFRLPGNCLLLTTSLPPLLLLSTNFYILFSNRCWINRLCGFFFFFFMITAAIAKLGRKLSAHLQGRCAQHREQWGSNKKKQKGGIYISEYL